MISYVALIMKNINVFFGDTSPALKKGEDLHKKSIDLSKSSHKFLERYLTNRSIDLWRKFSLYLWFFRKNHSSSIHFYK